MLIRKRWIDRHTAAVVLEVLVYAGNVNLITTITALFEFLPFGGIAIAESVRSMKLYHVTGGVQVFVLVVEVLYIAFTFYFCVQSVRNIFREKAKFISFWNIVDVMIILVSLLTIIIYIVYVVHSYNIMAIYKNTRTLHFQYLVLLKSLVDTCLGVLITYGMIKFLHLLRFNPMMFKFTSVLRVLGFEILMFCIMFFVFIMAFSSLMYLLAASAVEIFATLPRAMATLFMLLIDIFQYDSVAEFHSFWGPFLFLLYLFVGIFFLYSLMISMFVRGLHEISRNPQPSDDTELLMMLLAKVSYILGLKGLTNPSTIEYELENQQVSQNAKVSKQHKE